MSNLKSGGYHIHFYFEVNEIEVGHAVRKQFVEDLKEVQGTGTVRSHPVGPHPLPMFESWFKNEYLDTVIRWAMLNRHGLSVMIHPLSGDDLADHRDHSVWLGKPLALNLEIFR